jgi:hypothetical protein
MKNKLMLILTLLLTANLFFSCEKDKDEDQDDQRTIDTYYQPVIKPENFIDSITNPYLPMIPGTIFTYKGVTEDGNENIVVAVTYDTKTIMGVTCLVVSDIVTEEGGQVLESTLDWYAQDIDGNVWYFGEDTKEYNNGIPISTEGSWEAGINGAQPGIVMPGTPIFGVPYRQEYLFDEAEDMGKVIKGGESVTVPFGTFDNCLVTEEWTPLEPDVEENKYYAAGIGIVKEVTVKGGTDVVELIAITTGRK